MFCSRPSRLFSGDASALFAPDAQLYSVSVILDSPLSSPFAFQLDTEQSAYSQFWNILRPQLQIFAPGNGLNNWILVHVDRLFLCPNYMVGKKAVSPPGGVQFLHPENVGIELAKDARQSQENSLAILSWNIESPIIVPPGWFLRYVMLDNGGGFGFLPAGTKITLSMMRQIIPVDFATEE